MKFKFWKKSVYSLFLIPLFAFLCGCEGNSDKNEGELIPSPVLPHLKTMRETGFNLTIPKILNIYVDSHMGEVAISSLRIFLPDFEIKVTSKKDALIQFYFDNNISAYAEYYEITTDKKNIRVSHKDALGARNAASTIAALISYTDTGYIIPCGYIEDYPDSRFRSALLESSGRAWLTIDEIKEHLVRMALCKMNYMHFHFMEYMGCSVKLDSCSKLAGYGAKNMKYTKDEIKELIRFADSIGMQIIPGIEIPAHAQALLASYPALRCKPLDGSRTSTWVVCAGSEETYRMFEAIIAEISELFPCDYIHIGADELDFGEDSGWEPAWLKCSECGKLSDKEGIETERGIYYYVINKIYDIAKSHNKQIIMFNDQIDISESPDIPRDIIIHFWRIASEGRGPYEGCSFNRFLEEGFTVINSYYPETYIDFEEYATAESIMKWSPKKVPESNPEYGEQILGGEFCAWEDHKHFKYTIPAATVLYGDRLWNNDKSFEYNGEYGRKMTRLIFGVHTPADFNLFEYLGGVFPPRDDTNMAYLDKINADTDALLQVKDILSDIAQHHTYSVNAAKAYYACIDWVLNNSKS